MVSNLAEKVSQPESCVDENAVAEAKSPQKKRLRSLVLIAVPATIVLFASTARAFDLGSLGSLFSSGGGSGLSGEFGNLEQNIGSNLGQQANSYGSNFIGSMGGKLSQSVGNLPFGLGGIFDNMIQKYTGIAQDFLSSTINHELGSVMGGTLGQSTGSMGIADPAATQAAVVNTINGTGSGSGTTAGSNNASSDGAATSNATGDQQGNATAQAQKIDGFNQNPAALQQSLSFEDDRANGRALAATEISQAGQSATAAAIKAGTQTLQAIASKSQKAQSMDVTQDVMKNLTDMISNQSTLEGGSYTELMQVDQHEAMNNELAANISETLDETNRAHHAESIAGASSVMENAAGVYLPGSTK